MVPPAESNLGQRREFYGFREKEERVALGSRDKWVSTYFTRGKWRGQKMYLRDKSKDVCMSVCTYRAIHSSFDTVDFGCLTWGLK